MIRRIRSIAAERKVPISHLPDRAAVSRSHFFDVMKGEKSPTLKWLGKVADALDVDAGDLVARQPR